MDVHILHWLESRRQVVEALNKEGKCLELAKKKAKKPKKLRQAEPDDIRKSAIVWHYVDKRWYWHYVEELGYYGDPWKAYTAHDGCRYGLDGAFIEVETNNNKEA